MIGNSLGDRFVRHTLRVTSYLALAGAVLLVCAGHADAVGIDCKKAGSGAEHLICNDPDLNSLDSQLDEAYHGALDRSAHPQQVKEKQSAWLKLRDTCTDAKCMSATYQRQIKLLMAVSDEPAICSGSTTPEIEGCAAEHARRADRELARYVAAARKRLIDEGKDETTGGPAKMALVDFDASQAAWAAYRKAECNAVYDWWSEGTIRGTMAQECLRSVTKSRTTDVWSTWLGFMDSTLPLLPKPGRN